jgi:hypothetical protein
MTVPMGPTSTLRYRLATRQKLRIKIGSGCPDASPAGLATITGEVFAKFNVARNSNNRIGVEFHAEG